MIYYRYLYKVKQLTANEGIVFSALLSHSVTTNFSECFMQDGTFAIDIVKDSIKEDGGDEFIDYEPISINKLAKDLEMTRVTIRKVIKSLKEKHILGNYVIACSIKLLEKGYITLPSGTGLSGKQLLFYAAILERSKIFNGVIDTQAYKLAEITGITKAQAYATLHILEAKGFAKRTKDNDLIVY